MPRILIADDKASSRELVRTILQHLGHEVCEVADGVEAFRAIETDPPDLVLLDIQMPGMTGHEVVARVRQNRALQTLPIVALTANAMAGDRERAIQAGFSSYLSKPVSLNTLRSEISRLLVLDPRS